MDDMAESVRNLLQDIKTEADAMVGEHEESTSNALIAIKLSIDRLVGELRFDSQSKQVIKTLAFFSEKSISKELLISCAECYIDNPEQVSVVM